MKKVYVAHSISTFGEFEDSKRVANEIRRLNYDVYVASENLAINDKTNEPTVEDIYNGDVEEILSSDIVVVNLSGGHQDGTISEVGYTSGFNDTLRLLSEKLPEKLFYEVMSYLGFDKKCIIGYTSNARLINPQFHKGTASAHANHLVLGMIERWGEFVGGEADMIRNLRERSV